MSSPGTERWSDLSKVTQLMNRAMNTGLLTGNLRLFPMPDYPLEQDFSMCGPQINCIKIVWCRGGFWASPTSFVRNADSWVPVQTYWIHYLEHGAHKWAFKSSSYPLQRDRSTLKFESPCFREWSDTPPQPFLPTNHDTGSNQPAKPAVPTTCLSRATHSGEHRCAQVGGRGRGRQPALASGFAVGWCLLWGTLWMDTITRGAQVGALLADMHPMSHKPAPSRGPDYSRNSIHAL